MMLGILRRNFEDVSCECFLNLYKTMVRPLLEYANSIWSPGRVCDLTKIEKIQMKATRYMCHSKNLSYDDRLHRLKLPTLNYRRIRGDMIELYKIITGKYDSNCGLQLYLRSKSVHASLTRDNGKTVISTMHYRYDLRKYYFTNRVVPVWNSLPNEVVMADKVTILIYSRIVLISSGHCMILFIYYLFRA